MESRTASYLADRLAHGPWRMGQLEVQPSGKIHHVDDAARTDLIIATDPYAALEISRTDDDGRYRPLKSAPNLRHGWRLELNDLAEVALALDFLYPAGIATAAAFARGELTSVCLRETLSRQSGMYAVVAKLNNAQVDDLVGTVCQKSSGCLRRILWRIDLNRATPRTEVGLASDLDEVPLLCAEACNYFVAAGRKLLKGLAS